mmetsp:Transcript_33564/g.51619  ORF Transcript_33564/g.51619 Transcript_33564/m.51619 type:complete len:117 (-) Transcript_33564:1607-1957(-)
MDSFSDEEKQMLSQTNSKSLEQCINRKRTHLSQRPELILDSKTSIGNKVRHSGLSSSFMEDTDIHFQDQKNSVTELRKEVQGQFNTSAFHTISQKSSLSNLHSAFSNDAGSPNRRA